MVAADGITNGPCSVQTFCAVARYTHQNCVRVVPPEDGQVMRDTCRGFEL
jgi:hypothetical protein